MTDREKMALIEEQTKLVEEYRIWERMQTNYGYHDETFKYCQAKMDALDERAEFIRGVLEGRWANDRS